MSEHVYLVVGATGRLGGQTFEALRARRIAGNQIVATGRNRARLAQLAASSVHVRYADLDDTDTLEPSSRGATHMLLISASEPGDRVRQHTAADLETVVSEIRGVAGLEFAVHHLDVTQLAKVMSGAGLPAAAAQIFADVDRAIADGELLVSTQPLTGLLGRPPLALSSAAVRDALGLGMFGTEGRAA